MLEKESFYVRADANLKRREIESALEAMGARTKIIGKMVIAISGPMTTIVRVSQEGEMAKVTTRHIYRPLGRMFASRSMGCKGY